MKNTIKLAIAALLLLGFAQCKEASTNNDTPPKADSTASSSSIADMHLLVWDEAINQLMEMVDSFPENKMNFRPHKDAKTVAEQLVHLGETSITLSNTFIKGMPRQTEFPKTNIDSMSKQEITLFLKQRLDSVRATIAQTSNDQFLNDKVTSFYNRDMTKLEGMMYVHDHITHHKGSINLYLLLVGKSEPNYMYY